MTETLFGEPVPDRTRRAGIGSHHSHASQTDDWLTPPWLLARLGKFDLDPCTPASGMPWPTAARMIGPADDGLAGAWDGRVWLNPPYSEAYRWMARLAAHGDGIGLVFARTETVGFFETVWTHADALLFLRGRLTFLQPDGRPPDSSRGSGNAGAPSVLVAFGERNAAALADCSDLGAYVTGWTVPLAPGQDRLL